MLKKIWDLVLFFLKKIWQWLFGKGKMKELEPALQSGADKVLLRTSRNEVDGKLQIFEGIMPDDLHGVFYAVYPVGSVNSNGLPFSQTINGKNNIEYGTPIMNGDGMMISISFNGASQPVIMSRLMKTPCFFADYNSRQGTDPHIPFGFLNFGISRMSLVLGTRNELNTAAIPVKFKNYNPFLLSTYDVGRPFITDPVSMKLQTPIGQNSDWVPGTPDFLPWPLPMLQTTAHPSFDPITEEVFTVNYTMLSDGKAYVHNPRTIFHLQNNPLIFEERLVALCRGMQNETDSDKMKERLQDFFDNLDHYILGADKIGPESKHPVETSVWLMRWKGEEQIEKWTLTDQSGNKLQIKECMHQTALTRDFIVLTDCAFKFSLDLLVNNPFPGNPELDRFLRKLMAGTMLPYTDCYIVKRAELAAGGGSATAYKLQSPIPLETIHYSCDYENPGGKITLIGIHNTAACVAEWIRPDDESQITGGPISDEMVSLFALGSMDVNRIGKWVIDTNSLKIDETNSKQYYDTGKTSQPDMGPNTWTLGLYTFRDIISPTTIVPQIKYMWYVANGLDSRMLTKFIYGLYENYENRIVPAEEIVRLTKEDLPQTLVRLNCSNMLPDDHYQFKKLTYVRSLHFIPRPKPSPGIAYELDGHIFCTLQSPIPLLEPAVYRSEYWVFDAARLSAGPVCKFMFDDIRFCFTLHTAWLETALPYDLPFDVDIKQDYDSVIEKLFDKGILQDYFNDHVYPDWYAQKNTP